MKGSGRILTALLQDASNRSNIKTVPVNKLSVAITMVLASVILHEQLPLNAVMDRILAAAGTLMMVLQFYLNRNSFSVPVCPSLS